LLFSKLQSKNDSLLYICIPHFKQYFTSHNLQQKELSTKNIKIDKTKDIGRSPRMQYHSLSLASLPHTHVDVIGYQESTPHPALVANPNITIIPISPFPSLPRALFLLYAPCKVILQVIVLFWILICKIARPDYILIQNPPSIPTLFVVRVVGWMRGSKVVVDWHNLGYTLLQLSMHTSDSHPIISFSRWFERFFGGGAYAHFCVTQKMKEMLVKEWQFPADRITVLYDRPPSFFKALSPQEKSEFLSYFTANIKTHSGQSISILPGSAIVVSSTSWTQDEDFGVLLDACVAYDEAAKHRNELPPITLIITGKGPQREYYEKKIAQLGMNKVSIYTVWLSATDYPRLLGASDLGVCLHTSSSKLDLPMKVVDMLGTELPVSAISINYPALDELLPNQKFGTHFTDSEQLNQQFQTLLQNYPKSTKLNKMRENIHQAKREGWDDNWKTNAKPVFYS